jgi:hypothetical protein
MPVPATRVLPAHGNANSQQQYPVARHASGFTAFFSQTYLHTAIYRLKTSFYLKSFALTP